MSKCQRPLDKANNNIKNERHPKRMQPKKENGLGSAIKKVEALLKKVEAKLTRLWDAISSWFQKRGDALLDGIKGLAHIVKNGANGEWVRIERAIAWFSEYMEKHSPLDGAILGGLIAVIVTLVIVTRR